MGSSSISAKSEACNQSQFSSYTISVVMTTVLFLIIFVAGSSWTMVVTKAFENKPCITKYWIFAVFMTLMTMFVALAFGGLSKWMNSRVNININNLLSDDFE